MKVFAIEKSEPTGRRIKGLLAAAMVAVLSIGLAACDQDDGKMEKVGKSIDETATDVGNAVEDKCEEAKDSVGMEDTRC